MREMKLPQQHRPRPPKRGAAGRLASQARCTAAGPPQQITAPAGVHAPWQDLGTSGNSPQGGLRSAQGPSCWIGRFLVLVFPLCLALAVLPAAYLLTLIFAPRRAQTHWRTQRRIHGIYKRRPHTQHKPDTSTYWWQSRVGPKSGGPAQIPRNLRSQAPGLGEVHSAVDFGFSAFGLAKPMFGAWQCAVTQGEVCAQVNY